MSNKDEMSFFEHLEELRWHLIRSIVAILVFAIVVFIFKDFVFNNIIFAPRSKDFPTYRFFCNLSDITCFFPPEFQVQTRKLEEAFVSHIKISVIMGFVLAFPYFFWEIWKFIRPGLKTKEVKAVRGVVFVCSFLFFLGVLFGYYIVTPFAITFLASYNLGDLLMEPTLGSYINNLVMYSVPVGLVFEMPVLIVALTKIGVLTSSFLKKQRKIAFVLLITLSAIVTPPDIFTQFIIGIPLYLLFEISIALAARIEKSKKRRKMSRPALERVSTGMTLVLKIFFPVFWFVFFFSFLVALWFSDESQLGMLQDNSFRIPYTVLFLLFTFLIYKTIWQLHRVEVGEHFLYVYTYFRNARYPYHNIEKIREFNLGILYLGRITLKVPGRLGNNLFFIQSRKRHRKVLAKHESYRDLWTYG